MDCIMFSNLRLRAAKGGGRKREEEEEREGGRRFLCESFLLSPVRVDGARIEWNR